MDDKEHNGLYGVVLELSPYRALTCMDLLGESLMGELFQPRDLVFVRHDVDSNVHNHRTTDQVEYVLEVAGLHNEVSDLRCKHIRFAVCVKELLGCQRLSGQGRESTKDSITAHGVIFGVAERIPIGSKVREYGCIVFVKVDNPCNGFLLSLEGRVWK